jgi:hypothetical protein
MWDGIIVKEVKIDFLKLNTRLLSQINFGRQATKQLKLHPFSSFWALKYLTHYIRARREIMLESRLASTPYISENRLSKMPPEKLIWWSLRIVKKSLIKMFSSNSIIVKAKVYNFVTVLNNN